MLDGLCQVFRTIFRMGSDRWGLRIRPESTLGCLSLIPLIRHLPTISFHQIEILFKRSTVQPEPKRYAFSFNKTLYASVRKCPIRHTCLYTLLPGAAQISRA